MIMRVTWGKIKPGKWDEYERMWNEHARNTSGAAGLKGRWLLRDADNQDAGYSLTLWESAEDFERYSAEVMPAIATQMADCFVGQYVTTACEVRGSDLSGLA